MSTFLQLHALTFYPPANLNRDDTGRPKTAIVGGSPRLRISSQCLKRSWRTGPFFQEAMADHLGIRTRSLGSELRRFLEERDVAEKKALAWSQSLLNPFGKTDDQAHHKTMVHYGPAEREAIFAVAETLATEKREPTKEECLVATRHHRAVDIALFGRMLAENHAYSGEAAVQVAHAFSVNRARVEDDYFTAVDDLNRDHEPGAGHLNQQWFGSGVFYLYINVHQDLLLNNLEGNRELAGQALRALTESILRVSPSGKQNSFAALSQAGFLLAERGSSQPRSLALAFANALDKGDLQKQAVDALRDTRQKLDSCYECGPEDECEFHPWAGTGKLSQLLDFVGEV